MTNKSAAVVLVHDQEKNLPLLFESYRRQSAQPDLFIFVLDRCSDSSRQLVEHFALERPVAFVEVSGTGFLAGRNRDIGLKIAEDKLGSCDVLFFDGDCVLEPNVIREHLKVLCANSEYPTVSIGRRINEKSEGIEGFDEDNRFKSLITYDKVFKSKMHHLVISREAAFHRMLTWSCNLGLNSKAISLVRQVNYALNCENRIFNSIFDGRWGGEDDFIGLTALFFGIAVVAIDPSVFVKHIWHPSREHDRYAYTTILKIGQLRRLANRVKAPGITTIRCRRANDDFNRIANMQECIVRSPILSKLLAEYSDFDRAALSTVLSAHVCWELSEPIDKPRSFADRWQDLRSKLADLQVKPIDALKLLPTLEWNWSWPIKQECGICGSDLGYSGNGRCRSCNSFPWHRAFKAARIESSGRKLAINAEFRGERALFDGWEFASYTGLHGDAKIDLMQIDCADQTYDLIYSGHTLEHVRDEFKALRELRRVLKPNGRLVLSLPCDSANQTREDVTNRLGKRQRIDQFGWHDHWRIYGRDVVERLASAGFKVETLQAWNSGDLPGVEPDETLFVLSPLPIGSSVSDGPSPTNLFLDIYQSCNFKCQHCDIHKLNDNGPTPITLYKQAIEEYAMLGGKTVSFSSGETLLVSDVVLELVRHASQLRIDAFLVTNGSRVRSLDDAQQLIDAGLKSIVISIDSHVPEEHDRIRGVKGAYAMATRAIEFFKEARGGRQFEIKTSCVLTKRNLEAYPDYVTAMLELGADTVTATALEPTFARFNASDRAPSMDANVDPYFFENRLDDVELVRSVMQEAHRRGAAFQEQDIEFFTHYASGSSIAPGTCNSAERNLILLKDGSIKLCYPKPPVAKYSSFGDLIRFWNGNVAKGRREQDRYCTRPCAISACHRRSD